MGVDKNILIGPNENHVYLAILRRSGHAMAVDAPKWFMTLGVKTILSQSQSESDGNITLIITFRKD